MPATTSKSLNACVVSALALAMVACGGMSPSTTTTTSASSVAVSLNQAAVTLGVGATSQFTASVQNTTNTAVSWSVDTVAGGNSTVGTISAAGLYTAPSQAGNHTVTATSVADTTKSANAAVTVGMLGAISPASVVIPPSSTQQFSTTVQGFSNTSVNWAVDQVAGGNASVGTISATGLYTAPSQSGSHTVAATSVADSSLTATASVSVTTISLSPATATLASSQTQQFTATIPGASSANLTWSVDNVAGGNSTVGTISATGVYTAPVQAGSHTVTAASGAGASVSASASITVVGFTISPASSAINPSTTQQFTASIQGLTNTAVTWSVDNIAGGNASVGTISATGLYTAPAATGPYTIEATSSANTALFASTPLTVINFSQASVLTYHNDDARDGAYTQEVTLTPSNVTSTQFGKLLAYPVDGQIYAQPLYMFHLNIAGGTSDVVFVETQNNSVYAFDADATAAKPTTFWHVNFGAPVAANDLGGPYPNVGILSTPVIDASTNTMYLVTELNKSGPTFWLHALNVTTGQDILSPVQITATDPNSTQTLEAGCYQRMGLALNSTTNWIYLAFGSCDNGWVLAYDKTSLAQKAVFNVTSNAEGGGLWAGGGAPVVDDQSGNIYLMSGTDYDDAYIQPPPTYTQTGYNDAFLNLNPTTLEVQSSFTPDDNYTLSANDVDLGSGGAILVQGNSQYPKLLIGGGKDGNVFVVNPLDMGGYNSTNKVIQTLQTGTQQYNNIFSTPVFWNNTVYYHENDDVLRAYTWNPSASEPLAATNLSGGVTYTNFHGATASLSSNGPTNGIIWDIDNSAYVKTGNGTSPCVLHAYNATNLNELYNSSQAAGGRDTAGYALKFTVPTIANGRVFVPTSNELDIYGLLP